MAQKAQSAADSQLKFRVEKALREPLEKSAERRGVSLNREITDRLWKSLTSERSDEQLMFYSPHLRGVMEVIAAVMQFAGHASALNSTLADSSPQSWLENPYAYEQAVKAAAVALETFRPAGDQTAPASAGDKKIGHGWDDVLSKMADKFGESVARVILEEIASGQARTIGSAMRTKQLRENIGPVLLDRLISKLGDQK